MAITIVTQNRQKSPTLRMDFDNETKILINENFKSRARLIS